MVLSCFISFFQRFLRIKHGLSTSWCPHFLKRNWANPMMKCGRFWRARNHLNSSKLMAEAGDDMADIVFFSGDQGKLTHTHLVSGLMWFIIYNPYTTHMYIYIVGYIPYITVSFSPIYDLWAPSFPFESSQRFQNSEILGFWDFGMIRIGWSQQMTIISI